MEHSLALKNYHITNSVFLLLHNSRLLNYEIHRENSISPWFIKFWCSNCSYLLQIFKHLSLTNKNNLRQIFMKKVTNEKRGNILSTFFLFNPLCWAFLKFFECACNESCEVGVTCCAYKHVWQVIFTPIMISTHTLHTTKWSSC